MKNILRYLLAAVSVILIAASCNKSNNSNGSGSLSAKADAQAAYNAQSGGVYKGVLVGSTGSLEITLQDGKLIAEVTIDGVTKTLAATNLQNWTSGQDIDSASFVNGDWSIIFSVHGDGTGVHVRAIIPGHDDITVVIAKEHSDKQVVTYEGTYTVDSLKHSDSASGDQTQLHFSGTWNFISYDSHIAGIYRSPQGQIFPFQGTITDGVLNASFEDLEIHGSFQENNANGVWESATLKGSWTGKRKL